MHQTSIKASILLIALALLTNVVALEKITRQTTPPIQQNPKADFKVTFAPDYVACDIPRRFYVEVEFKKDFTPLQISVPNEVKLLDHYDTISNFEFDNLTKSAAPRKLRRFFFETRHPAKRAVITLKNASGQARIPFTIWNYEQLRAKRFINGYPFPRRYPLHGSLPYLKARQTLNLPMPKISDPVAITPFLRKRTKFKDKIKLHDFTLQEFWDIAPECAYLMRKNHPAPQDPIHLKKVFKKSGDPFYSYAMTMPRPGDSKSYYCLSPIDGRKIPDNDFGRGKYSGKYVDDGMNGIEINGTKNYFISQIAVMRAIDMYTRTAQAAALYRQTQDLKYANLALTGLCRIAVEHNFMSTMMSSRRTHQSRFVSLRLVDAFPPTRFGNCGFMIDGIWTTGNMMHLAEAYDNVFPAISDNLEIYNFLAAKKLPVSNSVELRRFIEENVFLTYLQAQLDGMQNSNYPHTEMGFLQIVRLLDYPMNEFMDIIYNGDDRLFPHGIARKLFQQQFFRDGVKIESPGGYNRHANATVMKIFDYINALRRAPYMKNQLGNYPDFSHDPSWVTALESQIKHSTTGKTKILLGDGGTLTGYRTYGNKHRKTYLKSDYFGDETSELFRQVFSNYPEPEIAWALANSPRCRPDKNCALTRQELKKIAAQLPRQWENRANVLSGIGVAFLRGGIKQDRRTFYAHYGKILGHAHDSTMGLYFDAYNSRLMTNWGYPSAWDRFYYNWMPQNTGRAFPWVLNKKLFMLGQNRLTLNSGSLAVMDNQADLIQDRIADIEQLAGQSSRYKTQKTNVQRRITALINVNAKDFYAIDYYRMNQGSQHWRTFHTLDGPVELKGITLKRQAKGTVAGENVPYNSQRWVKKHGGTEAAIGFVRLYNVERGKVQNQPFEATWSINDSDNLKVRLSCLDAGKADIYLADARDPNQASPFVQRFLLWQHSAPQSMVLNTIEAYRGTAVLQGKRRLNVSGDATAVAVELKLPDRWHYVILSDTQKTKKIQVNPQLNIELTGRIALVAVDFAGKILERTLIQGSSLKVNRTQLTLAQPEITGRITGVNYPKWQIVVEPQITTPLPYRAHIYIQRGGIEIPLEVKKLVNKNGRSYITLNTNPLQFNTRVKSYRDSQLSFMPTPDPRYWQSRKTIANRSGYKRYHQTQLISPQGNVFRVDTISSRSIVLTEKISAAQLKALFPLGTWLTIYDYGVGDTIRIPLGKTRKNKAQ